MDTNYNETTRDVKLVVFGLPNLATQISGSLTSEKFAPNKKFFIVSGKTFKLLLMSSDSKSGDATREYYVKVEDLARMMHIYCREFNWMANNQPKITNERIIPKISLDILSEYTIHFYIIYKITPRIPALISA